MLQHKYKNKRSELIKQINPLKGKLCRLRIEAQTLHAYRINDDPSNKFIKSQFEMKNDELFVFADAVISAFTTQIMCLTPSNGLFFIYLPMKFYEFIEVVS
jgi:hypothetical protein